VKACFYQAALLAGPGVLIGAYVMGLIVYYLCPFGWSWYLCMIFGSIVSATDPVAVVAILKDLGASPKLTILIVGESLMNDGTAMVLFTLYFKLMEGTEFSGGDVIWYLIKMVVCSPLLGIAFGLCGVYCLGRADNPLGGQDTTIQIGITVSTAYMSFYVAQYECEISGILACCAAGLMFAFLGPPLILEHETMHSVWGFIEWTGNTLIFLLAGVIIGSNLGNHEITATDFGYVLALYLILLCVRALVIAVLFPGLSRLGLKASAGEAKFMVWAGLRGALAIALSLIVYGEHEEIGISKKEADHLLFWIGGIAALTLLVNATTAQHVLVWLGKMTLLDC
jgi:NhaP-type Na+/H+ or K+/H+ antiporter